jgi:hypothetical protein
MARCLNCGFSLVLLSNRRKYKCAKCSKLFNQKEIDGKEFIVWNKAQNELDKETSKQEFEKEWEDLKKVKEQIELLFNGSSKKNDVEIINLKTRLRRKENLELYRRKEKIWRNKNPKMLKTYWRIHYYRKKQKELTLHYLGNSGYGGSEGDIFRSVPTNLHSELLRG